MYTINPAVLNMMTLQQPMPSDPRVRTNPAFNPNEGMTPYMQPVGQQPMANPAMAAAGMGASVGGGHPGANTGAIGAGVQQGMQAARAMMGMTPEQHSGARTMALMAIGAHPRQEKDWSQRFLGSTMAGAQAFAQQQAAAQALNEKLMEAEHKKRMEEYKMQKEAHEFENESATQRRGHDIAEEHYRQMSEDRNAAIAARAEKKPALSYVGKMLKERQDAENGLAADGTPLSSEEQKDRVNKLNLALLKHTTDAKTRDRTLNAINLVKSIENANVDDLVRYSGPQGHANLVWEQTKDLAGQASEEYQKYKEAQKAVALEAQELRQALGTSITPYMDKALREMVDASSLGVSPETAKKMVNKSRGIIRKQMDTLMNALVSEKAYTYEGESGEESPDVATQSKNGSNEAFKEEGKKVFATENTSPLTTEIIPLARKAIPELEGRDDAQAIASAQFRIREVRNAHPELEKATDAQVLTAIIRAREKGVEL